MGVRCAAKLRQIFNAGARECDDARHSHSSGPVEEAAGRVGLGFGGSMVKGVICRVRVDPRSDRPYGPPQEPIEIGTLTREKLD